MLTFTWFLLKVLLCSSIFFGYYWLALRNKRFHLYNRFYLLSSVLLSWIIPLLKIDFWEVSPEQPLVIKLLSVVDNGDVYLDETVSKATSSTWNYDSIFVVAFIIISAFFASVLLTTLIRIMLLIKSNPKEKWDKIYFVFTQTKGTPFSFFNYIFWNRQIDTNTPEGDCILKHELAHVHEKHSADKLFINLILVFGWYNPVFWFIRKEISLIHEFIADKKAIGNGNSHDFALMLLKANYPAQSFTLTNSFYYSPIKRRLLMMTTSKLPRFSYLRKMMIFPVLVFVFVFFAFKAKDNSKYRLYELNRTYTVVIDAGHGGSDDGAISFDGILEKNLVLVLAQQVKALNTDKNIRIVLSRENDESMSPKERVAFLEKTKADLFISLHMNSANGMEGQPEKFRGAEINLPRYNDIFIKESTVLGSLMSKNLENIFNAVTPLKQKKAGIWVLKANNVCPSVLLEAGYMSYKEDVERMSRKEKEKEIAQSILTTINQFFKYKEQENKDLTPGNILPVEVEGSSPAVIQTPEVFKQNRIETSNINTEFKPVIFSVDGMFAKKKGSC